MANARIVLGGEIDVASGDELSSGLNALGADIKGSMGKAKRIMRPLSKAVSGLNLTQGQTVQVVMPRVSAGRIWVVTRIVVLGDDDNTTKTGVVASLYIGDDANIGLSQCVRHATTVPFTTTENEHAYVVHDREALFLNVTATAAGPITGQIVFNAIAWEYRDVDIDTQVI